MFGFFFHCFSTKKRGGPKASRKTRDTTAGKRDRQAFTDLIA